MQKRLHKLAYLGIIVEGKNETWSGWTSDEASSGARGAAPLPLLVQ